MLEKNKTRLAWAIGGSLCLLATGKAEANTPLWSVLDRVPRGLHFLAVDVSWGNNVNNVQNVVTGGTIANQAAGGMYMFRDEFVWGGYAYSGMVYAKIRKGDYPHPDWGCAVGQCGFDTRRNPNANLVSGTPAASYERTRDMINALTADACGSDKYHRNCAEWLRVGQTAASSGRSCIMPDPLDTGCAPDMLFIQSILSGTLLTPPSLVLPGLSGSSTLSGSMVPPGPPGGGVLPPLPPAPPPTVPPWIATPPYISYRSTMTATVCSKYAVEFYPDNNPRGFVSNAPSFALVPDPLSPTPAGKDPFGTTYAAGCPCPPDGNCTIYAQKVAGMSSCPVLNPYYELAHELQGFYYNYPRFTDSDGDGDADPDANVVKTELCDVWALGFNKLDAKRHACLNAPNLFLSDTSDNGSNPYCAAPYCVAASHSGPNNFSCNHTALALELCNPALSGFAVTCLCNPFQAGCAGGSPVVPAPCGASNHPPISARQYVAVCHADRLTDGGLAPREAINAAPVSTESASNNPNMCRPSFMSFVTDGVGYSNIQWGTPTPETIKHAAIYRRGKAHMGATAYPSFDGFSLGVTESDVWDSDGGGDGDNMKKLLNANALPAYNTNPFYVRPAINFSAGTPEERIRNKLARDLQKSLAGVYSGGSPGMSRLQDRAAVMVTEIPGTREVTAATSAGGVCGRADQEANPADCYLGYFGRPTRMEWYSIPAASTAFTRLWETDNTGIAIGANPRCYNITGTNSCSAAGNLTAQLGIPVNTAGTPYIAAGSARWYGATGPNTGNFISVNVPANLLDRDGDGTIEGTSPPVRWGPHLGGESTRPVIVEAPSTDVVGKDTSNFATWRRNALCGTVEKAIQCRARMTYTLSEGYLIGYATGAYNGTAFTFDGVKVKYGYSDNAGVDQVYAGSWRVGNEVFRYRPSFLTNAANASGVSIDGRPAYQWNDLKPGHGILGGEIVVRDIEFRGTVAGATNQFGTVLFFSQGRGGRGYGAIDVSEPNYMGNAKRGVDRFLWEYTIPAGPDNDGDGIADNRATSRPNVFHWPMAAGATRPAVAITGGAGYPRMIAIDAMNGVAISTAVLPAGQDYLGEVSCVDALGYGRVTHCYTLGTAGAVVRVEINRPAGTFGAVTTIYSAPGTFSSSLVAYFTADNSVALVFGSGDASPRALERLTGTTNYLYKVVDPIGKIGANSSAAQVSTATSKACNFDQNTTFESGVIALPAGLTIINTPAVSKGTVVFSAYVPPANACSAGDTRVVGFDFENCQDILNPASTATPVPVDPTAGQAGMPSTPVLLRRADAVVAFSSETPRTASGVGGLETRGGQGHEMIVPVYLRPNTIVQ
ncbi:MAG: hypothetical protein HY791_19840 [Deltaproteobacteria bacterium]|nr:hypothetical protein [Deltaproteobacteria bacterium]